MSRRLRTTIPPRRPSLSPPFTHASLPSYEGDASSRSLHMTNLLNPSNQGKSSVSNHPKDTISSELSKSIPATPDNTSSMPKAHSTAVIRDIYYQSLNRLHSNSTYLTSTYLHRIHCLSPPSPKHLRHSQP